MFPLTFKLKPLLSSILLFSVLSGLTGCSLFGNSEPEYSRVKRASKEAVVKDLQVSYRDLNLALGNELLTSKIRAVEVFQNSTAVSQNYPNFRLFDIDPASVYALLGLANADILVAINERIVVAPQVIGQVVSLLPKEKGVQFEILREGKSTLIRVQFVK